MEKKSRKKVAQRVGCLWPARVRIPASHMLLSPPFPSPRSTKQCRARCGPKTKQSHEQMKGGMGQQCGSVAERLSFMCETGFVLKLHPGVAQDLILA